MPGTSGGVRGDISFDVGEEELWQQVGRLAGVVGDISLKLHVQQAEIQLQESVLSAEEEMLNLSDRLRKNQDEDTYDAELNKSIQTMNQFRPKNPLAARDYDAWVRRQTPGWKSDVKKAKEIRLNNKWEAMRDTLAEQAIRNGTLTKLGMHMATGVALGRTNEAAAGKFLRDTRHAAEFEAAKRIAFNNPDRALELLKEDEMEGFVLLDIDDLKRVRDIARARQFDLESQYDKQQLAEIESLWDLSLREATTSEDIIQAIDNLQFHNAKEKDQLLRQTLSRYELIQKGKGDPLRYRKDDEAFWDLYQKAVDNDTTERDFRKAVNQGKITVTDYQTLNNVLTEMGGENKGTNREINTAMKDMEELLTATGYFDPSILKTAKIKARMALEAKINERKKTTKPLAGRELTEEMLKIERAIEREMAGALTPEDILPPPKPYAGLDIRKLERLERELTVSPYEEYPDAFFEDGTWKVIRNGKKYRIED